jgi:hypothetical protein
MCLVKSDCQRSRREGLRILSRKRARDGTPAGTVYSRFTVCPSLFAGYAHGLTTYTSAVKQGADKGRAPAVSEPEDASNDEEVEREEYAMRQPPAPGRRGEEQTVYVIEFETEEEGKGESRRSRGGKDMADGESGVQLRPNWLFKDFS